MHGPMNVKFVISLSCPVLHKLTVLPALGQMLSYVIKWWLILSDCLWSPHCGLAERFV